MMIHMNFLNIISPGKECVELFFWGWGMEKGEEM